MFSLLRRSQHFPAVHLTSAARLTQMTSGFPGASTVSGAISSAPAVSGILLLAAPASARALRPLSARTTTARTVVTSSFPLVSAVSGASYASPPISGILLIRSPAICDMASTITKDSPPIRYYCTSGGDSSGDGDGYELIGKVCGVISELFDLVIKSAYMSSAAIIDLLPDLEYVESVLKQLSTYLFEMIKGVMKEKFLKMSDELARKLLEMLLEKGFQKLAEITGLLERFKIKLDDTKKETPYFYFHNVQEVHIHVTVNK